MQRCNSTASSRRCYLQHQWNSGLHTTPTPIHGRRGGFKSVTEVPAAATVTSSQQSHAAWPATVQPARQQVQRQRRRRTRQTVAEPDSFEEDSDALNTCASQAAAPAVFYIPIGFEAAAAEACRRAGVVLTELEQLAAPLPDIDAAAAAAPAADAVTIAADETASATVPSSNASLWQGLGDMADKLPASELPRQQGEQQRPRRQRRQQQVPQQPDAASPVSASAETALATAPAAWQLAVSKRLAAGSATPHLKASKSAPATTISSISKARLSRWGPVAVSTKSRSSTGNAGVSDAFAAAPAASSRSVQKDLLSSSDRLGMYRQQHLSGKQLSQEAEAELCEMYQAYLHLEETLRPTLQQHLLQQHLLQQQQPQQQQLQQGDTLPRPSPVAVAEQLAHAAAAQRQGLMAQELLLQLYHPMIVNRALRAQQQQPGADTRELLAAARRGLLQAAAKFDRGRAVANLRLVGLAERYMKTALRDVLREYQTGAVSLPVHVTQLRSKLMKLEAQLQLQRGSKPSLVELAAAAAVTLKQAERALQATAGQATGLMEAGGGDDDGPGAVGGDVDLQRLAVSSELDEVESVAEGGVKASRSGLHEALDDAAETAALASVLQHFIMQLPDRDRTFLSMRIGLTPPTDTAAAAADASQQQHHQHFHQRQHTRVQGSGVTEKPSQDAGSVKGTTATMPESSAAAASAADGGGGDGGLLARHAVGDEGMTLTEIGHHFNMSRQRSHQIMDGAVKQLRQWLQEAARSDAEVALLLTGQGGKLAQEAGAGR